MGWFLRCKVNKVMLLLFCILGVLVSGAKPVLADFQSAGSRWNQSQKRVVLPILWEKSLSDFSQGGVVTETEHYREKWVLVIEPGLDIYLISPRGRVLVNGLDYSGGLGNMPRKLVLARENFAILFGVPITESLPIDGEVYNDPELVSISINNEKNADQRFDFGINKDTYLQVQFTVVR